MNHETGSHVGRVSIPGKPDMKFTSYGPWCREWNPDLQKLKTDDTDSDTDAILSQARNGVATIMSGMETRPTTPDYDNDNRSADNDLFSRGVKAEPEPGSCYMKNSRYRFRYRRRCRLSGEPSNSRAPVVYHRCREGCSSGKTDNLQLITHN